MPRKDSGYMVQRMLNLPGRREREDHRGGSWEYLQRVGVTEDAKNKVRWRQMICSGN